MAVDVISLGAQDVQDWNIKMGAAFGAAFMIVNHLGEKLALMEVVHNNNCALYWI